MEYLYSFMVNILRNVPEFYEKSQIALGPVCNLGDYCKIMEKDTYKIYSLLNVFLMVLPIFINL